MDLSSLSLPTGRLAPGAGTVSVLFAVHPQHPGQNLALGDCLVRVSTGTGGMPVAGRVPKASELVREPRPSSTVRLLCSHAGVFTLWNHPLLWGPEGISSALELGQGQGKTMTLTSVQLSM